jgi:hypothetical protein
MHEYLYWLVPGSYNVVVQGGLSNCTFVETVAVELCSFYIADIDVTHVSSSSDASGTIAITPGAGVEPFQYSNDGGTTFTSDNTFLNLAVGNYNVVVKDATGYCEFKATVPVRITTSIESLNDDLSKNLIKMYPNPTIDWITIELIEGAPISGNVNIVITDLLGRQLHSATLSNKDNGKTSISLEGYAPGNYFVKCYSDNYEKTFKLIKM